MTDLIYTHSTVRVPEEPGHFLINPYSYRWKEITASSLVKIGVDGNKVGDNPNRVNPAGFTIHSAVHMSRHDTACVIHTHTRAGMAVSATKAGLMPISQLARQFYGRLGVHDYEGIALDLAERQRIIKDLGPFCGLTLRNHGLLTVGRKVAEAFSLMFYLNRACEVQVAASSMCAELVVPSNEVCERVGHQYDRIAIDDEGLQLEWAAHLRMLDATDPSYRT
jgi:ribulose-5-phosphate 4-epimerase/fuculose-1-phosphate aldolase